MCRNIQKSDVNANVGLNIEEKLARIRKIMRGMKIMRLVQKCDAGAA